MVVDTPESDGGGGGSGISFSLTKKVGPLPVWGWCVLAIAAVLIYKHYRPKAPAEDVTPEPSGGVANPELVAPPTSPIPPNNNVGSPGENNGNIWPQPETNAEWKALALAKLTSLNSWGAYQITNALSAYLGGAVLDSTQQPIVDTALKMVGPPPQAVAVPAGDSNKAQRTTIAVSLANPIPTKNGKPIHLSVAWHLTSDGSPISGVLLVQEMSAGTRNQWVDYSRVRITNGVGRWDHGTAAPGVRNVRVTVEKSDTKYTGVSNSVSVNLAP